MSEADRSGERAGKRRPRNREIKFSGKESWKFALHTRAVRAISGFIMLKQ